MRTEQQSAPAAAYAIGVKALIRAARRAHERGDTDERDRLLDEADDQLALTIQAMPPGRRERAAA